MAKKKMVELSLLDRFLIVPLLPQQWDYTAISNAKFLAKKIELVEDDMRLLMKSVLPNGDFIPTEEAKGGVQEFDLTENEISMIKDGLIMLDKSKQLTPTHISLYDKFITIKERIVFIQEEKTEAENKEVVDVDEKVLPV